METRYYNLRDINYGNQLIKSAPELVNVSPRLVLFPHTQRYHVHTRISLTVSDIRQASAPLSLFLSFFVVHNVGSVQVG